MADDDGERVINRSLIVTAALALVAAVGLSVWAYLRLPADAVVPVHWNSSGQVDGYAGKLAGLFGPLAILAVAIGVVLLVPYIEPRRQNLVRSAGAFRAVAYALIAFSAAFHAVIVLTALGAAVDVTRLAALGVGVLLMVIGNWLPKVRSNFMFGIRTPWTLSSDYVWRRTHRVGGRAFVLAGLALIVSAAVLSTRAAFIVMIGAAVVVGVGSMVYSYAVSRRAPDQRTGP